MARDIRGTITSGFAYMRIDPAGWPFVGGALVLAIIAMLAVSSIVGLVFVVIACVLLLFFRDPDRVMVAGASEGPECPLGRWQQISMFLSPLDVHVNRMPVGGHVTKVRYHPGGFLPAYRSDAGRLNEYTEVWVDRGGQPIVIRQVVGVLARRIVCRTKVGDEVRAGQRFGVMKFGSRMDVFVPTTADIKVKVGDRVVGAVTIIAKLRD